MNTQSQRQFHALSSGGRIRGPVSVAALLLFGILAVSAIGTRAQDVADTIRVRTRVVFLEALVKDKHTGIPISGLKPENFEVLDEGQSRPISYFTREGQARKPLALVLILDLREDGAGRFLKQPEVLKMMADELAKLPPEDEAAILAVNIGEDEKRVWLSDFTHDAGQLQAALARVPDYIGEPRATDNAAKEDQKQQSSQGKGSLSIGSDSKAKKSDAGAEQKPLPDDVLEVQVIKGKDGAVVTRTVKKDGTVSLKRVSSSGHVTVELEDVYDMVAAVKDATHKSEQQRPNSQPALVWVSDGIAPIFFEDRDATEQYLIRSNVIFNSLTADLRTLYKFLLPFGKPVMGWMGISVYGAAKRLAQQSGGEAMRVNRVKDYGSGLSTIIGNLTARYSLGFTLAEQENDDGRLHNLDVRVKAQDEKGKTRKLNVSARKGYYMSTTMDKEATAAKTQ
ncbi:MAG TPA: VWA domain-containing protein [Pyrinomonadaceae bacterium]